MSEPFTLLWGKILDSSVWQLDAPTRLVWITLLAMKDREGMVRTRSVVALANRARVSVDECRKALETFRSPDPESGNRDHEGRRIREVDEGWQILNHEAYRYSSDARRALWREIKAVEKALRDEGTKKVVKDKQEKANKEDLIRIHEAHAKELRKELKIG